jgi:cysteinyl-tRNA synthetase, unknown class
MLSISRRSVLTGLAATALAGPASAAVNPLKNVKTWMYVLQRLEFDAFVSQLAATNYDMLVFEPGYDFRDGPYNTASLVRRLKTKPNGSKRILLAYIDIGQAEDFRSYWKPGWNPDFLLAPDPDGWVGDVGVAFWRAGWKKIWLGPNGLIAKLAALGVDGFYMDWVGIYQEPATIAAARKDGVDPAREMVRFIAQIRNVHPGKLIVPQNAGELSTTPGYFNVIDGYGIEDTWYRGAANATWGSASAGDLKPEGTETTAQKLASYKAFQNRGVPVFTIDYCVKPLNAKRVYAEAKAAGVVPLVTRVSLDHLTSTPPPWLSAP